MKSLLALMSLWGAASSELVFSDGFTNDMVLQRGTNTAVYGFKDSGTTVTASLGQTVLEVEEVSDIEWRANIKPTAAGGDYSIKVSDTNSNSIYIERVTFGDVFFCSGQSNMQLPLHYTYEVGLLTEKVLNGSYSNIRFVNHPNGGVKPIYEPQWVTTQGNASWYNVTYSAGLPDNKTFEIGSLGKVQMNPFHGFSATCMHFAMSLIDKTGDTTTPIGLILSAVGGTQIEAWISNSTFDSCKNLSTPTGGGLYRANVAPFVNTSITGFLWYQGENNCGGFMGNSADGTGYGCAQVALVKSWREIWSVREGTTAPDAPFGVVSLAAGGSEGHGSNMARMRWSQTGNHGHLPNTAMPRTFMAQGYDIGDPWAQKAPVQNQCAHPNSSTGKYGPDCLPWGVADFPPPLQIIEPFVKNPHTPVYMGPIHPRIKLPVGRRLAEAYYNQFMDGTGALTGPTISGCSTSESSVTVKFNTTLLRNSKLAVNTAYNYTGFTDSNTMMICTASRGGNETTCNCLGWGSVVNNSTGKSIYFCADGPGWKPSPGVPFLLEHEMPENLKQSNPHINIWQPAPVVPDTDTTVKIDLTRVNTTGGIFAIKYGWSNGQDTCCSGDAFNYQPCFPAHCPIMDTTTWFPANPFFATITNGKCKCLPPQVCDE